MIDLIDACGNEIEAFLGVPYAGQEPQDKDGIPQAGLVIVERIGGGMSDRGRSDRPWIQFTVLASSKKRAWDQLRRIRKFWSTPRSTVGPHFVYGISEVSRPEEASLASDPFFRVRVTFKFHVKGLA